MPLFSAVSFDKASVNQLFASVAVDSDMLYDYFNAPEVFLDGMDSEYNGPLLQCYFRFCNFDRQDLYTVVSIRAKANDQLPFMLQ